jgi:hypothetical protein
LKGFRTLLFISVIASLSFSPPSLILSRATEHEKIILRGFDGNPLTLESRGPYSPRKTCGSCHDYNRITLGYHFQLGRTDGAGKIVVSDTFDQKYPWNLSSGMYGKHSLVSPDSTQLAKKVNQNPSDIDKTSFFFIQHCGSCHAGGGPGEVDRKGNLYYNEETKQFGYEISDDYALRDGDYTSINAGNPLFGASWDKSGPSEADCLLCHLKGYQWKERAAALKGGLFKYGPTVGAGWASGKLSEGGSGNQKMEEAEVDYTRKEVADFENLHLQIVRKPPDENCWFCHGLSDGKKRGWQWDPETDVHKAKGLACVSCHPGDKDHNFAKGDTLQGTVRDDLDHTMSSCEDCHTKGKDKNAPKVKHPFSPRHMKRITCQTCHIPFLTTPADLVVDHSTGETVIYDTSKFVSHNPTDSKKPIPEGASNLWYPSFRESKGKIVPVISQVAIYWGDLDEKTNVARPIFLWKIRDLKKPTFRDDNQDGIPEVNTLGEIKAFLNALKKNDRFGNPIALHPVLVKGGFLYQLNKKEEVEKIKYESSSMTDFSLSHNVMTGPAVIGSKGCIDCHSKKSSFFLRKMLIDPYDEKGKPVYIEAWEYLGISKEKLGRLLEEQ